VIFFENMEPLWVVVNRLRRLISSGYKLQHVKPGGMGKKPHQEKQDSSSWPSVQWQQ